MSTSLFDVAVVGGGPAGLAVAIAAASTGLSTVVFERVASVPDKACGEGLLPGGVRALERLGVLRHLERSAPDDGMFIRGIRYVQEDGTSVEAALPPPFGRGVRRTALAAALASRASEVGAVVHEGVTVARHTMVADGVKLVTDAGSVRAKVLVGADGLASPIREAAGLGARAPGVVARSGTSPFRAPRRFGLRQHFDVAPWTSCVEVHWAEGIEAYVTPVAPHRVGVAFLWAEGDAPSPPTIANFRRIFPRLDARIGDAPVASRVRGAGPLRRDVKRAVGVRVALVGDAAGYIDAITGEGLSLAFEGALLLAAVLPSSIAQGATIASLLPYERAFRRLYARYALVTDGVLALSRYPAARRWALRMFRRQPKAFAAALHIAVG